MSDSDEEIPTSRGSPPYSNNEEEEETDNNSEDGMIDNGDFLPITPGPNQLDDVDVFRTARNRVKLYVLCEQRVWDDRGTGHVACVEVPGQNSFVIIVRLEAADKNVLESKILMDTVYQKQQETLIVWSESESCDLALSFQEKTGCEEIWAKICEVQGKDPNDAQDGSFDEPDESEPSESSLFDKRVKIPPVSQGRLSELDQAMTYHLANNERREKMSMAIEKENMIPKLIEIFKMSEDFEDTPTLHLLYNITKNAILMNRTNVHDILFDDKHLKDIVGMLEYDPAHEHPRKHREFLFEKAQFREVLPIADSEIKDKIHKVYRVQYIQDVCLPAPSLFEENLMGALNSFLFFLRVDICTGLQSNEAFMNELFDQLKSSSITLARRRDLVQFLKEFLNLSQSSPNSQCQQKELILKLFECLFNSDILGTIEPCIESSDPVIKSTIVELLMKLVEHNQQLVREYFIKQAKGKEEDDMLLNMLLRHMLSDQDPELGSANLVADILLKLLDMDSIVSTMQKCDRSEFLNLFYQNSFKTLMKPYLENVSNGSLRRDDYHTANKTALVIRLLCFCIETHSFNMRAQVVTNDLLNKVLIALRSKHHFLVLGALKMLRSVVAMKDDYYNRYIIREKVFDKVVACFVKNGPRYNLLNSAILELFEFIRTEDIRNLLKYVMETHGDVLCQVTYVKVFTDMKQRYETLKDREGKNGSDSRSSSQADKSPTNTKSEEQWFDGEDEEVEVNLDEEEEQESSSKKQEPSPPSIRRKLNIDEASDVFAPLLHPLERKIVIKIGEDRSRTPSPSPSTPPSHVREDEVSSSQNGKENQPSAATSVLKPLVDYDGSSSDESDEEENGNSGDSVPSSSTGSPDHPKAEATVSHNRSPPGEDSVSSTSGDTEESNRAAKRQLTYADDEEDEEAESCKRRRSDESENGTNSDGDDTETKEEDTSGSPDLTQCNGEEKKELNGDCPVDVALKNNIKQATEALYCVVDPYDTTNDVERGSHETLRNVQINQINRDN